MRLSASCQAGATAYHLNSTSARPLIRSTITMAHRILLFGTLALVGAISSPAAAQTYSAKKARRHFVTVSLDWLFTQPLHFADHPLSDLLGTEVGAAQLQTFDYSTRDGETLIDVLEFKRRSRGAGITVYPLGLSSGPTLGIRASFEDLPTIRLAFEGPGPLDNYALTDARAYDVGAGFWVADRSAGWGLGSHAFVDGGIGKIHGDLGNGSRFFAEGGGGLTSGPFGIELSVKFAWNTLDEPVKHHFVTIPVTLRGTLTF
jgi:hypothetical protein